MEQRVAERLRLARQRQDGAVVIGVGVNVQQTHAGDIGRGGEPADDLRSSALREVRDGLEEAHGRSSSERISWSAPSAGSASGATKRASEISSDGRKVPAT